MTNDQEPNHHLKAAAKASGAFYFKQFKVEDGRSTMKVGTDAVLLGTVAEPEDAVSILEIGTGCGVIALILAQRSNAIIDAIEIDRASVEQASENARNSLWKDRINIIHKSLKDYTRHAAKNYDLIISNPPFFSRSLKSPCNKRNISRHNDELSFEELIHGSLKLLTQEGSLWIILPVNEGEEFMEMAGNSNLFIHFISKIIPKEGKSPHRIILQFKKTPIENTIVKTLVIRLHDNSYSEEYMHVTKEFYIDF